MEKLQDCRTFDWNVFGATNCLGIASGDILCIQVRAHITMKKAKDAKWDNANQIVCTVALRHVYKRARFLVWHILLCCFFTWDMRVWSGHCSIFSRLCRPLRPLVKVATVKGPKKTKTTLSIGWHCHELPSHQKTWQWRFDSWDSQNFTNKFNLAVTMLF